MSHSTRREAQKLSALGPKIVGPPGGENSRPPLSQTNPRHPKHSRPVFPKHSRRPTKSRPPLADKFTAPRSEQFTAPNEHAPLPIHSSTQSWLHKFVGLSFLCGVRQSGASCPFAFEHTVEPLTDVFHKPCLAISKVVDGVSSFLSEGLLFSGLCALLTSSSFDGVMGTRKTSAAHAAAKAPEASRRTRTCRPTFASV